MTNRTQLIEKLVAEFNLKSMKEGDSFLVGFAKVIKDHLQETGQAPLPGLGKLVTQERAARTGRNPRTGESVEIPAKTVVKFREGSSKASAAE